MKITIGRLIAVAVLVFVVPWTAQAATEGQKCEAKKGVAAGSYFKCRAAASAVYTKNADEIRRNLKFAKCSEKFDKLFQKAEDQFACSAEGDGPAIRNFLDDASSGVANFLALQGPEPFLGGLPATGSDRCWDTNGREIDCDGHGAFGQDGQARPGVPIGYTDNGDGTVTAHGTGLMWEKKLYDGGINDFTHYYPWSGFCSFRPPSTVWAGNGLACMRDSDCPIGTGTCNIYNCGSLAGDPCTPSTDGQGGQDTIWDWLDRLNGAYGTPFAGYRDWRIPNVMEMFSIAIHNTGASGGCPLVPEAFYSGDCAVYPPSACTSCSCSYLGSHWTSSTYVSLNVTSAGGCRESTASSPSGYWPETLALSVDNAGSYGLVQPYRKWYSLPVRAVRGGRFPPSCEAAVFDICRNGASDTCRSCLLNSAALFSCTGAVFGDCSNENIDACAAAARDVGCVGECGCR